MATKRIAIIGGGPIGLEAALYGRARGFDVALYERQTIAANVLQWGHVRLFSPFGMNVSAWGRAALQAPPGQGPLPADDAFLTGREFAEQYLLPLSRLPQLRNLIHEQTAVLGISRWNCWKGDLIGRPARGDDPFRLLLQSADGTQHNATADYVFDCSGVYPHHNWLGAGGLPAVGENAAAPIIDYRLPDILGADREQYARRATLVVGSGYSAATAVCALADLAAEQPGTRILWLVRHDRTLPLEVIADDPLPQRRGLTERANALAMSAGSPVTFLPRRMIIEIQSTGKQGGHRVCIRGENGDETLTVDRIIANVGYHPDRELYAELQMHECYATSGPIKLAAALLGETSGDCLQQPSGGAETLRNPEPGFFILGAKSYGRDSRFLIRTGLQQIVDVFDLIDGDRAALLSATPRQGGAAQ